MLRISEEIRVKSEKLRCLPLANEFNFSSRKGNILFGTVHNEFDIYKLKNQLCLRGGLFILFVNLAKAFEEKVFVIDYFAFAVGDNFL